jgi:hypothetical protein
VPAPRQYQPHAALPGAGLPGDRLARLAARRAFVGLKLVYLDALDAVSGHEAVWLRHQVRSAAEPEDLWLLRAPVFAALAGPERRDLRHALRRALSSIFAEAQPPSAFSAL